MIASGFDSIQAVVFRVQDGCMSALGSLNEVQKDLNIKPDITPYGLMKQRKYS